MDFNTVKRKLSDLRKSLEASGALQTTKKKAPSKSRARQRTQDNQNARSATTTNTTTLAEVPTQAIGVAMTAAPATQMTGYMGSQQPHTLPPNLQLSVLGLQHTGASFNPTAAQQPQQQPLNLQTGGNTGGQGGDQPQPQALPLNLHSMGGHMPSYYLSLGHMSNLISLPVSSGGAVQSAGTQTTNFTAQHNMQQFIPTHSTVSAQTETTPGTAGQPHVIQGGVGVTYTAAPQHNPNMY